jgi:pimeloyl-ACP methyl ester carboxylesterase
MLRVYCVPGLANDKRMFDNLAPLLKSQDIHFLEHLEPAHPKETMTEYARRLSMTIDHHDENSVIIGMSLGGIISVELSKILPMKKVFLVSTIKHPSELPWQVKLLRNLPLDKVKIPAWLIRKGVKPITWLMGVTDAKGRHHISSMIQDADDRHIAWAQWAAANWDNNLIPDNYIHIHGTKDEIFPASQVKASHFIEGANHYMIMDRADDVAQIINSELSELLQPQQQPSRMHI